MFSLGGTHGGWHFQDHDVFLRVWVQTQTPAAVTTVSLSCDAIRVESISVVGVPTTSSMKNEEDDDNGTAVATVAGSVTTIATMNDIGNVNATDIDSASDISAAQNTVESPLTFQYIVPSVQKLKIVRKLTPLLSHKTAEMIDQHIEWYLKFLALTQAKKTLIQQWKLSKFNNSENEATDDGGDGIDKNSGSLIDTIFSLDAKSTIEGRSEEERKLMKAQVAQWKQSRETESQQRRQLEELVRHQKERDELDKKKKRQMELKVD